MIDKKEAILQFCILKEFLNIMSGLLSTRVVLGTCNLNQWALDFDGNQMRIEESIREAKRLGATYRLGPELEISGYSCEDHFLEIDTFTHSEESLASILSSDVTQGILCDIGCPFIFDGVRYNCRVFCLNGQILLIRPKMYLADDGNYREKRFFSSWTDKENLHEYRFSNILQKATGQISCKFGIGVIETQETIVAAEVCEELWSTESPHTGFALGGVEIIGNGSGSHHQLRKLDTRLNAIRAATVKAGGCYLYSNQRGCDGNRLYFDGCSLIYMNGDCLAQASQFSLKDVEVITATIDLAAIRNHRHALASFQEQSAKARRLLKIDASFFSLCGDASTQIANLMRPISSSISPRVHIPEEECALGPACWLWDYMCRSKASGYLLPLSGGADSASVAAIVRVMCGLAVQECESGNDTVKSHIKRLLGIEDEMDKRWKEFIENSNIEERGNILCNYVLHTTYMGTKNSSMLTHNRARTLAEQIGSYHNVIRIDVIFDAILTVLGTFTSKVPRYESQGGSKVEDIALQNIQARIRMVMAYLSAQLLPWIRNRSGFLLVLGSANVDEALRGYMTKYDCSSADVNPIGGICKLDLKRLLTWTSKTYGYTALQEIADAKPSAELRPIDDNVDQEKDGYTQTDEEDMGMTYEELGIFGSLRKIQRCGPVSMFSKLVSVWHTISPEEVAKKVKRFFYFYSLNRHKLTVLTPSYHAENYSPDDNRFDLRQFLYNTAWTRQFQTIDSWAKKLTDLKD
jgi:NAD+ synthase (glutamine-hydrolysing)